MDIKPLVTRNINCSELTVEEFATMMIEDMENARKVYDDIWYHIELKVHNDLIVSQKNALVNYARKFAEKHWKTERKRNEYVEKELNKFVNPEFSYRTISYFDFDIKPWRNGISSNCVLSYDNMTFEAMARCFNEIKDNKYFKVAKGWVLEDHHGFRPQIKLILDEDVEKEFKKDGENLSNAIANFYKGTNYWGD